MIFIFVRYLYCILMGILITAAQDQSKLPISSQVTAYRNKRNQIIKAGDTVRLTSSAFKTHSHNQNQELFGGIPITKAQVRSVFKDVKGLVLLKQRLGGYWTWNVEDLEKVE